MVSLGSSYKPPADKDLYPKSVITEHIDQFSPVLVVLSDLDDLGQVQTSEFFNGLNHNEVGQFAKVLIGFEN